MSVGIAKKTTSLLVGQSVAIILGIKRNERAKGGNS